MATGAYRVAIVAGETSGDQLGAALIGALRERCPDLKVRGVCGPLMQALGCEPLASASELSVMGLAEVLTHLPRLLRLRRRLRREFSAWRPEVFIGIDAPEFNLGLAAQLHKAGLKTVQYVSPQVWAWRQRRVSHIARTCDLVLCLLPFEPAFYARHAVRAEFVGHPLADQIPLDVDRRAARERLGLRAEGDRDRRCSRGAGAVRSRDSGPDFLAAAGLLAQRWPAAQFIAPVAAPHLRSLLENELRRAALPFGAHAIARRPGAGRAPGGRCRACGLGHRQPRGTPVRLSDGGGLPPQSGDRLHAARAAHGAPAVFLASQSARR